MDECHNRPKYTEHVTALPFRDWQSNLTAAGPRPEIQFDPKEREIVTSENARLLELGVIELEAAVHTPMNSFPLFLLGKKKRPIPH